MSAATSVSVRLTIEEYRQAWVEAACEVLGQIAGVPFKSQTSTVPAPDRPDSAASCFCLSLGAPLTGQQALLVPPADAQTLSRLLMGESPDDKSAGLDADPGDALAELVRQIAGGAAIALGARLRAQIEARLLSAERPSWLPRSQAGFTVQLSSSPSQAASFRVQLSAELLAALDSGEVSSGDAKAGKLLGVAQREPNLEFLRDIELNVTLRFGKRNVTLGEILEIIPGAVLELDQQVHEPVELLVGRKVIARGEVVVVDGNYGLRITELVSPAERIESLRT